MVASVFKSLKTLFGRTETKSVSVGSIDALIQLFGGIQTTAGISVGPETALRYTPVLAAVRAISETVASIPCRLYRRDDTGARTRADDHPAYRLIHDFPNGWASAAELFGFVTTQLLLTGNGFAFVNRSGDGSPVEIIALPSTAVTVTTEATLEPSYVVTTSDGTQRQIDRADMIHLRAITGADPNIGLSPIALGRESIALGLVLERYAAALFGRGARPSGFLKYSKMLGPDMLARIKSSFSSDHAGPDGAGKTLILEDGLSFEQMQMTSTDAQFLELRAHQVAEIARIFRVPLTFLMDYDRATWGNSETMNQQFLDHTLLPYLRIWQGALAKALLTEEERATHYFEFNTDELLKADIAARFTAYAQAIGNGILSPNEVRARENLPPYQGGDEHRVPMNSEAPGATDGAA